MSSFQLRFGDMCSRADLNGYKQVTLAQNPNEVERIARGLGLDAVPFAVMVGNGEYWVCTDRDINNPHVAYEFAGFQGRLQ